MLEDAEDNEKDDESDISMLSIHDMSKKVVKRNKNEHEVERMTKEEIDEVIGQCNKRSKEGFSSEENVQPHCKDCNCNDKCFIEVMKDMDLQKDKDILRESYYLLLSSLQRQERETEERIVESLQKELESRKAQESLNH